MALEWIHEEMLIKCFQPDMLTIVKVELTKRA